MNMKTVLITGCSSGIGLSTAKLLKYKGWNIFATARNEKDLFMLSELGFNTIYLDITDTNSVKNCAKEVIHRSNGTLCALVNNAGIGVPGAIEDLNRNSMITQFEVNLFGLLELTNLLIPHLIRKSHARIINVSSVVGRIAVPFMGIYSASKFALEAATDAQRIELANTPIRVSLIQPGPIYSNFSKSCLKTVESLSSNSQSRYKKQYNKYYSDRKSNNLAEDRFRLQPEAVSKKILHALESKNPKVRYKVTIPAYIIEFLVRFSPTFITDKFFKKQISSYIN